MSRTDRKEDDGRSSDRPVSRLSLPRLMAFGFPALPHAFVALPLNIVIPAFYATHTSVTLLQIGVFTSASRLLDAVLDPMVGFLSDRTNTPWGRRKPWTLAAGLVCAAALFFLFQPPRDATIQYYGFWSFLLYFGFSLFEIPRMAWSAEISRDYKERSRINTSAAQFNVAGSLIFWLMPILLFKLSGTTSITGASLTAIAWLYLLLMPAGLIVAAVRVPGGAPVTTLPLHLRDIVASVRLNRPLRCYLVAYGLWGLGQGAALSSTLLFLSDHMRMASAFPFLMIALFVTTIAVMPLWSQFAVRMGRHRIWAISLVLSAIARPLALLIAPGPGALWPMLALTCLSGALTAPWNFAPPAMLSDVIDYDLLKTRTNKAGNIFALNTLLVKASMAIGAGGAFVVLDRLHYHAGTSNTGSGETGLLICYMLIPAVLHILSAMVGWEFPLTARRQSIVRRRLETAGARAAAVV
jgi:GPH family glycoside/pentoside/hexuronide:cation symporter